MRLRDVPAFVIVTLWHAPGRLWAGMMRAAKPAFWAQVGAAMVSTLGVLVYGLVIWKGPWPLDRAEQQLDLLGQGQIIFALLALVALACITGLSVGVSASRSGFNAKVGRDDDDDPPAAVITTTTKVETPKQPSEDEPPWERKP